MKTHRALLSASDKTGLVEFARSLSELGWSLLSTGGTAAALREAGLRVTEVAEITGHPEILGGRVKTLHPAVHSGLLHRRRHPEDERQMALHGYESIDLLVVNLYPFRETISRPGVADAEAIEQIDIGGPAMLRSAAKNHQDVWVVVDPRDYGRVLAAIAGQPEESRGLRRELAAKVFAHTSAYDSAIASYLSRETTSEDRTRVAFPDEIKLDLRKVQSLRYGENPSQGAAFYRSADGSGGLPEMEQLHGKELSFNNLLDVDGALLALESWSDDDSAACVIVKHTTPCGLAIGSHVEEAYAKALATDPLSAFGSVVAFNRPVNATCAERLRPNFVEAVVAPAFEEAALELLKEKKNIRLLRLPMDRRAAGLEFKGVRGGFLVQEPLAGGSQADWRVVSRRAPSDEEVEDLRFAWKAIASVKSNAILLARAGMTIGIGAGQMSRVDASRIAVMKARDNGHETRGSVLASDAFFPFRDGIDAAAESGVTAVVQPGGSVRDPEVIEAADEHGIAMIFTGARLFRH